MANRTARVEPRLRRRRRALLERDRTAATASAAFAPSGPPACAMSGRPPPPCPPSAAAAARTRSTALIRAVRSSVTPTATAARPALIATMTATPLPSRALASSTRPRSALASMPSTTWPTKPMPATCSIAAPDASPPARGPARARAFFASASSRSSRRRSSTSAATRSGTSSGRLLSAAAAALSRSSCSVRKVRAASPVSASMRRTPLATRQFADDLEQGDVAQRGDVRAAAQLGRVIRRVAGAAHAEDADFVAVFLAEQRHGPGRDRRVGRHQARLRRACSRGCGG